MSGQLGFFRIGALKGWFRIQRIGLISGDESIFEKEVLEGLSRQGLLEAYQHAGFWQCMDTLRDVKILNDLWNSGDRPWIYR